MKTKTKKYTQTDFANLFTCLDQPGASRLLNGKDKVSWPLAAELSQMFPARSFLEWKHASKQDLNLLYNQLKRETKETA